MACFNLDALFKTGKVAFNPETRQKRRWTLSATGDYGILPAFAKVIGETGGRDLADNINQLIAADVSIANLEIGLADPSQVAAPGVRGDRDVFMKFHQAAPFTVYSLANNHILDAGPDEFHRTLEAFKSENIRYVGAGLNRTEAESPCFVDVKGTTVGIVAFAQNENQIAGETTPGAAELCWEKTLDAARKLVASCTVPIVIMHEGFEFMDFPRFKFRELCRELAESGVKLVIGHHSHVPQGVESVGESLIFYSLGNFFFDQPHFVPYPWSRRSFVPVVAFDGDAIVGVEIRPLTIELSPPTVRPDTEEERAALLTHIEENSAIIADDIAMRRENDRFFSSVLLPEFFGFLRNYGNRNNGDFSALITRFKQQVTVHKLFADFLEMYGDEQTGI